MPPHSAVMLELKGRHLLLLISRRCPRPLHHISECRLPCLQCSPARLLQHCAHPETSSWRFSRVLCWPQGRPYQWNREQRQPLQQPQQGCLQDGDRCHRGCQARYDLQPSHRSPHLPPRTWQGVIQHRSREKELDSNPTTPHQTFIPSEISSRLEHRKDLLLISITYLEGMVFLN
jgi:hypothetical protein